MYWIYQNHQPLRAFNTREEAIQYYKNQMAQWEQSGINPIKLADIALSYTCDYMGTSVSLIL